MLFHVYSLHCNSQVFLKFQSDSQVSLKLHSDSQVSLKLHSQVSLKIHSQIKCPSSQHCSDHIFVITWESSCIRTQVLYLTHSVLPEKALHFWLLGFNLSFLLQLKCWLLVVSSPLRVSLFRFHLLKWTFNQSCF